MLSLGIDIGYSSISITVIDSNKQIKENKYSMHKGELRDILLHFLDDIVTKYNPESFSCGSITGSGRYRTAKTIKGISSIDGTINAVSMYENTAISLNILHRGLKSRNSNPMLNLTFDGNINENDQTKVESFIYYLK